MISKGCSISSVDLERVCGGWDQPSAGGIKPTTPVQKAALACARHSVGAHVFLGDVNFTAQRPLITHSSRGTGVLVSTGDENTRNPGGVWRAWVGPKGQCNGMDKF